MKWGVPLPDHVAQPAAMQGLIQRGLDANPDNPALHAKLGFLRFDHKRFAEAAAAFEAALRLDPTAAQLRPILARCYVHLRRYRDALNVLLAHDGALVDRGRALMELGEAQAAAKEFEAVLERDPDEAQALRFLGRLLRKSGSNAQLLYLCETLFERGAANAQLFYLWGWALALAGDDDKARRLLFDPRRVVRFDLPAPTGFATVAQFNDDLAAEILGNPNKVIEFPTEDEANRGSQRIDDLFSGARCDLIRSLLDSIEEAIIAYEAPQREGFDPWPLARPSAARLRPWGLIQRNTDYEEGHIHPGGWLSGVYYVRVPRAITEGTGPGCIEFCPPSSIAVARPDLAPPKLYVPREGTLLLAPSHYQHRTIPSGIDEYRISVAFDVIPDIAA